MPDVPWPVSPADLNRFGVGEAEAEPAAQAIANLAHVIFGPFEPVAEEVWRAAEEQEFGPADLSALFADAAEAGDPSRFLGDFPDALVRLEQFMRARRQQVTREATGLTLDRRPERARRPQYLFSGLLSCGCCGGGFVLIGKTRYGCATARNKGTCDNRRTIERTVLKDRVLAGLKDRLLHPDLIAEFVAEYQREYTRLTRETRAARASAEHELAQVQRKIDQIVEAVCEGLFPASMKDKLTTLEERKATLAAQLQELNEEAIALNPGLAEVYRRKVAELTTALNVAGTKAEAAELLRGLLSAIRLILEGTGLAIELTGELAGIMTLGESRNDKTPAQGGGPVGRITMVAGAGYNEERTTGVLRILA